MIYIVLGMHKSGTTLVSQTLHHSGIQMGDSFDESAEYRDNKYEWREPFLINLDLLGADEKNYFSLDYYKPFEPTPPTHIQERIRSLVSLRESSSTDWGFKEPLTCLTYGPWSNNLPPHKLIGVYRSPSQVLKHYNAGLKHPHLGFRALRAWSNYNHAMLNALRSREEHSILLRYEELMSGSREFKRLEAFADRPLTDRRKTSEYHGRNENPLTGPLDTLMRLGSSPRPLKTLKELDEFRTSQIERDAHPTE